MKRIPADGTDSKEQTLRYGNKSMKKSLWNRFNGNAQLTVSDPPT